MPRHSSRGVESAPPELSVIVPAYNESRHLASNLAALLAYLHTLDLEWELIVVDDGSRDETPDIVRAQAAARLISYAPNRGKGYAVRQGVLAARGKWIVFLDADLSTPPEEIETALRYLQAGDDVVIGSRAHPEASVEQPPALFRRLSTAIFDQIKYLLVGLRDIADTQCGFKGYRSAAVRPLFARAVVDRFMFDVEILFLARRAGLQLREAPVRWRDAPGSSVRFWRGVFFMFRDLARIRWAHRGWPGSDMKKARG